MPSREVRQPIEFIDSCQNIQGCNIGYYEQYVANILDQMQKAHELASESFKNVQFVKKKIMTQNFLFINTRETIVCGI